MSNRLYLDGLFEVRAQLANLPEGLIDKARPIVESHAAGAEREIGAAYPERTHHLNFVEYMKHFERSTGRGTYTIDVVNEHWLARAFEWGTQARHTKIGANRGQMPAEHIFLPRYHRWHRAMVEALSDMLAGEGFTVTGDIDA